LFEASAVNSPRQSESPGVEGTLSCHDGPTPVVDVFIFYYYRAADCQWLFYYCNYVRTTQKQVF